MGGESGMDEASLDQIGFTGVDAGTLAESRRLQPRR